ncbi:MAG: DUF72 domain-containing protein [Syntrophobacteraceae bacterium]|nr:DUF72 domain-containing protein [Syntrophobacteraceae bacterium]
MARFDDFDPDSFRFRGLHPSVFLGTASDRYAGWMGQIYTEERYRKGITSRSKTVGGSRFTEVVLPVESVAEYFEHFRVLEIDYTFYQFLLDPQGKPTQSAHALKSYRGRMEPEDRLLLKVPQAVCARRILGAGRHVENRDFLNPDVFVRRFYEPAVDLLGAHLKGFIFEQEYHRKQDRMEPAEVAEAFDAFFSRIPGDDRYHLELRTESYLAKPLFETLEKHGVGQVLSHWTWLPPLGRQFDRAGRRFFNAAQGNVLRLMTPLGTRYEDAYAKAHPFDRLVPGMLQPEMIEGTVEIMRAGIAQGLPIHVIVNNRAGGNAPLIARMIAERFLDPR